MTERAQSAAPNASDGSSISAWQIRDCDGWGGIIGLVYQATASLLQPWIGLYTDKHPKPYLLPSGMVMTLIGIALLASAGSYAMLLVAAAVVGIGSATFHPEASRIARLGSGGRFGTAQSNFQVGGNTGSAIGPLLTAVIVIPYGQSAVAWFMVAAVIASWCGIGLPFGSSTTASPRPRAFQASTARAWPAARWCGRWW